MAIDRQLSQQINVDVFTTLCSSIAEEDDIPWQLLDHYQSVGRFNKGDK